MALLVRWVIRFPPIRDLALQAFQKFFSGLREKLVLFPGDMQPHFQLRLQRPEAQPDVLTILSRHRAYPMPSSTMIEALYSRLYVVVMFSFS